MGYNINSESILQYTCKEPPYAIESCCVWGRSYAVLTARQGQDLGTCKWGPTEHNCLSTVCMVQQGSDSAGAVYSSLGLGQAVVFPSYENVWNIKHFPVLHWDETETSGHF